MYEQLAVGPPLIDATLVALKPRAVRASPHAGPALPRAVLVHHDVIGVSDRANTSTYMRWELMRLLPDAYIDGTHAIDLYEADEAQLRAWCDPDSLRDIAEARVGLGATATATATANATATATARPAIWTTMFHVVNPH